MAARTNNKSVKIFAKVIFRTEIFHQNNPQIILHTLEPISQKLTPIQIKEKEELFKKIRC